MFIMVVENINFALVVVVFSGVAVANSVEVKRVRKRNREKEIKQEIVRAYCWLLAANYLDRYDSQNT
jgi:hypothetical protein